MATTKRISSAKVRSVAKALHRKAALRKVRRAHPRITRTATATGSGIVRFRASRVLDSLRTPTADNSLSKERTTR